MTTVKNLILGILLAAVAILPSFAQSSFPLTQPGNYAHITTKTTTVVKTGPGVLKAICINEQGTSTNTIKIEDAASDTTPVIANFDTTVQFGCFNFNLAFSTGLTVVTAGSGTQADITVVYQ